MKAMILAAGLGIRMQPLTFRTPKPLLSIGERTLLDRSLDALEQANINTVVVNTHHKADQIKAHLEERQRPNILLSHESTLLETGGGVLKALPLLGDDPFLVLNSDITWEGAQPLFTLCQAFQKSEMDVLLLLLPPKSVAGYDGPGDYFSDESGKLTWRHDAPEAPYLFSGIQILNPKIFEGKSGAFSLKALYDEAEKKGRLFGVVDAEGTWFHVGTPKAYEIAQKWFCQHTPTTFQH